MKLPGVISLRRICRSARDRREFDALGIEDVGEIGEDALGGFGPQIDDVGGIFNRTHESLEHEVELTRLGQFAAAIRTAIAFDMVGAKAMLAGFAIDERVGEILQMAGSFPGARMLQNGAVEPNHVVA